MLVPKGVWVRVPPLVPFIMRHRPPKARIRQLDFDDPKKRYYFSDERQEISTIVRYKNGNRMVEDVTHIANPVEYFKRKLIGK